MQARVIWHLARLLRSQWWAPESIARYQERAIVDMMRHAVTHVPFYRDLGISAGEIRELADLNRFPLVSKRMIQEAPERFLADGFDPHRLNHSRTSGSTGEPTVTYFDDDCWALTKYALKMRRIIAVASPIRRRCLIVSEQQPAELANYRRQRPFGAGLLYRERLVSLFDDIATHADVIRDFAPDMLYAFPSYFVELADHFERRQEPCPAIPWLFTSSEILTQPVRRRIESAFGGRVYDIYGSTEFKEIAWQCRHGSYHVNAESVFIESVPSSTANGAPSIVVSTLANRAMPLLRFQTGDLGALEHGTCACGRHTPRLRIREGREGDMLELPGGRRISPYLLTTVIEQIDGVRQYRIRQPAPTRLIVELQSAGELGTETLEHCKRQLLEVLQDSIDVSLETVASFARGAGGKHKVFVRSW